MSCRELLHPCAIEFDHKNNNSADNSLRNCFVVCSNCHRKHTVVQRRKVRDAFGNLVGYKPIKRKVGHKKEKRRTRRIPVRDFLGNIVSYKTVRVRPKKKGVRRKPRKRKARRSIFDIGL